MTSASWPTWPGQSGHLGRRVPRSAERFQHRGGSVGALGAPSEAETHAETAVAGQSGHLGRRVRRRLTLKPPSRVSRGTRGAECLRTSSRTRGTRAAECCAPHSRNRRHVDTLTRWTGTRTPHSGMSLEHSSAPTRGTWTPHVRTEYVSAVGSPDGQGCQRNVAPVHAPA